MSVKKTGHHPGLTICLIFSFILLLVLQDSPARGRISSNDEDASYRVKISGGSLSSAAGEDFKKLFQEAMKLYDEMDYEAAIKKFEAAQGTAKTAMQKADLYFYLSLSFYATLSERDRSELLSAIEKVCVFDYQREPDPDLCPSGYIEIFNELKGSYGAIKILSQPPGADVYINGNKTGITPLTIGAKAGPMDIRVTKGKVEKQDQLEVTAGEVISSPIYEVAGKKGKFPTFLVLGGLAIAGGVAAFALKGGGGGGGNGGGGGVTTGSIQISSSPTGAKVYLDGSDTGKTTNCTLTAISAGSHPLRLVLDNYGGWEGNVNVTAGQTTNVSANLSPFKYEKVSEWGGYGTGNGQLSYPSGVAGDSAGYIYVTDTGADRIQKFTSNGAYVAKWGVTGWKNGQFDHPYGIAVDNGNVYITDGSGRIQKFTTNGAFITTWGMGELASPEGLAIDNGYIYVADTGSNNIFKYSTNGKYVTQWGGQGTGKGKFSFPTGVAIDNSGSVYVSDADNFLVQKFASDGNFVIQWDTKSHYSGKPQGIAVDGDNFIHIAAGMAVLKFKSDGTFVTKWGDTDTPPTHLHGPRGLFFDDSGFVYVADCQASIIQKFRIYTQTSQNAKNHAATNLDTKGAKMGLRPGPFFGPSLRRNADHANHASGQIQKKHKK